MRRLSPEERVQRGADGLWDTRYAQGERPRDPMRCPPIHNREQAERAAALVIEALDGGDQPGPAFEKVVDMAKALGWDPENMTLDQVERVSDVWCAAHGIEWRQHHG